MAEDPWSAFGSDDEEDASDDGRTGHASVALHIAQTLLKTYPKVPLSKHRVGIFPEDGIGDEQALTVASLAQASKTRDMSVSTGCSLYDVILLVESLDGKSHAFRSATERLVPGGVLLVPTRRERAGQLDDSLFDPLYWKVLPETCEDPSNDGLIWKTLRKRKCRIQEKACPWLDSNHDHAHELDLVEAATVHRMASEIASRENRLTGHGVDQAAKALTEYGYCVIPQLLHADTCMKWGLAALADLHSAADILRSRDKVDLYNPSDSERDPGSYRELSMREDYRMDLRHGPQLEDLRGKNGSNEGSRPWMVRHDTDIGNRNEFFRGNVGLLEIVRRAMNGKPREKATGNFGRHNFDGSPPLTYQDARLGVIGTIISLPGAADQALHADTPHLFESVQEHLPPHYINAFAATIPSDDLVGQTAFIHKSHLLDEVAILLGDSRKQMWKQLVRPRLEPGDVVLFDCRILHFGLSNASKNVERPVLYTNMTIHWFHDPKNWDEHKRIFEEDQ